MAIKAKGAAKPTLHPIDKAIYVMVILLSWVLMIVTLTVANDNEEAIWQLDLMQKGVVTYGNGGEHFAAGVILWGILFFWPAYRLWKQKRLIMPLQYKGGRRPPQKKSGSAEKTLNVLLAILCVVCTVLVFTKDYSRWIMNEDYTVTEYSARNEVKDTYDCSPGHAQKVRLKVVSPSKSRAKYVEMTLRFDNGKRYTLDSAHFTGEEAVLTFMESFRAGLDRDIDVKISGKIEGFIRQKDITGPEADRWRALFEQER